MCAREKTAKKPLFRAKDHNGIVPKPKILKTKARRNKIQRAKLASKSIVCQFNDGLCNVCRAVGYKTNVHRCDRICRRIGHHLGQSYKIPLLAIKLATKPLPEIY